MLFKLIPVSLLASMAVANAGLFARHGNEAHSSEYDSTTTTTSTHVNTKTVYEEKPSGLVEVPEKHKEKPKACKHFVTVTIPDEEVVATPYGKQTDPASGYTPPPPKENNAGTPSHGVKPEDYLKWPVYSSIETSPESDDKKSKWAKPSHEAKPSNLPGKHTDDDDDEKSRAPKPSYAPKPSGKYDGDSPRQSSHAAHPSESYGSGPVSAVPSYAASASASRGPRPSGRPRPSEVYNSEEAPAYSSAAPAPAPAAPAPAYSESPAPAPVYSAEPIASPSASRGPRGPVGAQPSPTDNAAAPSNSDYALERPSGTWLQAPAASSAAPAPAPAPSSDEVVVVYQTVNVVPQPVSSSPPGRRALFKRY